MLTLMLRRPFLLLAFVGGVSVVVASNLHALPQNRRPIRGGSQPTGQTLRKYAETDRMPSLFNHDEETYDRYAACLAATEGLRRLRDRDMSDVIQGVTDVEDATRKRKQIASQYVHNSARVLRALGMSVNQFNELGKEVAQDAKLKEKIIEQAYLYRMAATIHLDRSPLPEKLPGGSAGSGDYLSNFQRDKVQLFCESMNEIEQVRSRQAELMKKNLRVDDFPPNINISDPALMPFLHPRVRDMIQAFPLQAEAIVKKHGLEAGEFNQMLHASKTNPIFRWKVQKHLKVGEAEATAAKADTTPDSPPSRPGVPRSSTAFGQATNMQQQLQQQQRAPPPRPAENPQRPPLQQTRPRPVAPPQY